MTGSQSYRRRARARDNAAEAAYDSRVDTDRGVRSRRRTTSSVSDPAGVDDVSRPGARGALPSADRHRRGRITQTGNTLARRLVVEAAWHYRHRPSVGQALARRRSRIEARIAERVPPGLRHDLEHLLEETAVASVTRFVWLRQFEPGGNSADTNRLLDRLKNLRLLDVPEGLFHAIPPHRVTRLRRQERVVCGRGRSTTLSRPHRVTVLRLQDASTFWPCWRSSPCDVTCRASPA